MAKRLILRKGTTTHHNTDKGDGSGFTGSEAEVTVDTTKKTAVVHDGSTVGGFPLVAETVAQTLTNKTLTTPIISSISNTGTLTLPTSTDTIVGRATTDTLTNKTLTTNTTLTSPTISGATMTGTTSFSDGGITNVGDIAAASVSADSTSLLLKTGGTERIHLHAAGVTQIDQKLLVGAELEAAGNGVANFTVGSSNGDDDTKCSFISDSMTLHKPALTAHDGEICKFYGLAASAIQVNIMYSIQKIGDGGFSGTNSYNLQNDWGELQEVSEQFSSEDDLISVNNVGSYTWIFTMTAPTAENWHIAFTITAWGVSCHNNGTKTGFEYTNLLND